MKATTLRAFLHQKHGACARWQVRLLALDPGAKTTGWAYFERGTLLDGGQIIAIGTNAMVELERLIERLKPELVVCESYSIYKWKAKEHIGSDLPVARLIGALELTCLHHKTPLVFQSAMVGKSWWKSDKLKAVGLYRVGEPHFMDACRHGCQWLTFGSPKGL